MIFKDAVTGSQQDSDTTGIKFPFNSESRFTSQLHHAPGSLRTVRESSCSAEQMRKAYTERLQDVLSPRFPMLYNEEKGKRGKNSHAKSV